MSISDESHRRSCFPVAEGGIGDQTAYLRSKRRCGHENGVLPGKRRIVFAAARFLAASPDWQGFAGLPMSGGKRAI